jgi:hypothetical protein
MTSAGCAPKEMAMPRKTPWTRKICHSEPEWTKERHIRARAQLRPEDMYRACVFWSDG